VATIRHCVIAVFITAPVDKFRRPDKMGLVSSRLLFGPAERDFYIDRGSVPNAVFDGIADCVP